MNGHFYYLGCLYDVSYTSWALSAATMTNGSLSPQPELEECEAALCFDYLLLNITVVLLLRRRGLDEEWRSTDQTLVFVSVHCWKSDAREWLF